MSDEYDSLTPSDPIRELGRISWLLRRYGSGCAVLAILVVFSIVLAFTLKANRLINASATALFCMGGFAVLELVGLVRFEQIRKQGEALAEVVSDDIQRSHEADWRGPWEFRVAIRTFTNASELPLLPGRYGPALYAFLAILLCVGSVVYWTSSIS